MKVIAITGGGSGIGRGIAWHFARAGYAVSITDRDRQAGKEALQVMREAGVDAIFVPGDVSKPAGVNRWLAQTKAELGCPDILINNAGIEIRKDVLTLSIAEFDKVIATNLRGTFICSQGAAKMMARRGHGGAIINISSTVSTQGAGGLAAYTACKGAMLELGRTQAVMHLRFRAR